MSVKVLIVTKSKDAKGRLKIVEEEPLGSFDDEQAAFEAIASHQLANPLKEARARSSFRGYRVVPG